MYQTESRKLIAMLVAFDATFLIRVILELTIYKHTLTDGYNQFLTLIINYTIQPIEDLLPLLIMFSIHYKNFKPNHTETSQQKNELGDKLVTETSQQKNELGDKFTIQEEHLDADSEYEEIVEEAEYLDNEELSRRDSDLFHDSQFGNTAKKNTLRRETVAPDQGNFDF